MKNPLADRGTRSVVFAVAAVILGVELLLRLAPDVPTELRWPSFEMDLKYRQMTEFADHGDRFDVVFVGTSQAVTDLDPTAFGEAARTTAYNAGYDSASMQSVRRWTLDVVEPLLRPKTVVLALGSRELNDAGIHQRDIDPLLRDSPGYQHHVGGVNLARRIEVFLEDISYVFRLRRVLRDPDSLALSLPDRPTHGSLGQRINLPSEYHYSEGFESWWRTIQLNDYTVGGDTWEALRDLQEELSRRGVRLVVVIMPVTSDYAGLHPRGADDVHVFRASLARFCGTSGCALVDALNAFATESVFYDPVHLNELGQRAFSTDLGNLWPGLSARQLVRMLAPPEGSGS